MGKKKHPTWTGLLCQQRRQHQHKILKPVPFTVGKSHEWIIGIKPTYGHQPPNAALDHKFQFLAELWLSAKRK